MLPLTLVAAPALAQGEPWALTPDERAYLDGRGPILYVHNPFSPPLSFTVNDHDVGIAPDLRHLMEVRLGLIFEHVVASNGTDMIARTLNGSVEWGIPFFTTKPNGIGLELAIAKSQVESMGGTIEHASVLGEGSIVTITLPAGHVVEPPAGAPR